MLTDINSATKHPPIVLLFRISLTNLLLIHITILFFSSNKLVPIKVHAAFII